MSAFWQALLASPPQLASGPLRTLEFDDQNFTFFSYAGHWEYYQGPNFPGGARNNTATIRTAVVPSETLPTFTTKVIPFSGTADEGIDFWGASEDGGPFVLLLRALDNPANSGWQQFGQPIGTGSYRYDWMPTNRRPGDNPGQSQNYDVTNLGQSYYDRLSYPGLVRLRGLPAGTYQFQVQKIANTNDLNDTGNKALYFDGSTVYTCHPTFS